MRKRREMKPEKLTPDPSKGELLKTSWSVQCKLFFEQSTIHGVKYIAENGCSRFENFLWFLCVTIGTVSTFVVIVNLWENFQTNPTITGLDTDFHDVAFPAVTICPEFPANKLRIRDYVNWSNFEYKRMTGLFPYLPDHAEKYISRLSELRVSSMASFADFPQHAVHADIYTETVRLNDNTRKYCFELMNTCEEVFATCSFKSMKMNCCEHFFPVFTENGFCYTFNSKHYERNLSWNKTELPEFEGPKNVEETDVSWTLSFRTQNAKNPMGIYIMSSDEELSNDIKPQYIWDNKINQLLFSVKQTYTTEDTRQLSVKQRHCYFPNERELKISPTYTYTACLKECRMDIAMRICNCVPYFYPQVQHYRHCTLEEYMCFKENNMEEIMSVNRCKCLLGCSNTVYQLEALYNTYGSTIKELNISMASWPLVRYKREVLFGWLDLLGSLGGIAGLFLGCSLLSGVEMLYYFTVRVFGMFIREKKELKRIRLEELARSPEDYNLSLIPFWMSEEVLPGNGYNVVARKYYGKKLHQMRNALAPQSSSKLNPEDVLLPPFGIDFLN